LFPVKKAPLYVQASPLGGSGVGWQGARFYAAQNPPFGATISYYLKDEIKTRRARRQDAERQAAKAGEDVFYPPWDSLKAEDHEETPAIMLTVTDPEGRVVRRLTGPVTSGIHRVAWDLRYPPPNPPRPQADSSDQQEEGFFGTPRGPYVVPGTYKVSLARRVDGAVTPLGEPQSLDVYLLDSNAARTPEVLAFQQKSWQLLRAVLGANAAATEIMNQVQQLRRAVQETPGIDDRLAAEVRSVEARLRDIQEALNGDPTVERRQESSPPSLAQRLGELGGGTWSGTLGDVTDTHKEQYEIVAREFPKVLESLRSLIEVDLKRVEDAAEAAGVPWTSGRVPKWP
jgi:hypothetical protein